MPGFDNENTEDNVCPTLQGSNKFDIWKNLLDLALGDGVYSNWERSAVTTPADDVPDIELPSHTTDDVSDYWRIDYLQSKLLADARLYWWLNRDQILEDLPNRAAPGDADAVTPELVEKLTHMGDKTFGDPRNAGIHNDPVARLLSNKTYTCSTGNPTRVISVEEDIEMTTDSGTQTLRPGIACEFGSPFPDGTFDDLPICGPNDILCKGQEPTPNPHYQCFRKCNCDAWPPPYQDVFEGEGVKYFRKWNGFRFTVGDSRTSSQINNIRNGDYRVCSTNDYFGETVPRPKDFCDDSGCNGCTPQCNCNLVCSMAQAGGRYANCFADEYDGGISSNIEVAEFCVDDGQCSSIQYCDTTNKACVTDPCFLRFGGGASQEKCLDPTFVESVLAACDGGAHQDVPTCDSECCAKVLSDYMQTCKCAALSHRNTFGTLLELDQHVCSGLTGTRPTCGH